MAAESSIYPFIAGLFGLTIGSFLNVCIYRLPRDLSIVTPRSFCPECESPISWFDNIPVFSYVLLRTRCRHCRKHIAIRYPLVEIATAILFGVAVARYGITFAALKWCLFEAFMVVLFTTDLEERILPDEFTIGGAFVGLVFALLVHVQGIIGELFLPAARPIIQSLVEALLAAFLLTGPIWLLGIFWGRFRKREVLGMGDVKLLPMLGLFLGLEQGIFALLVGSITGVVLGGGYIFFSHRRASEYELPLGSFFCLGAALVPLLTPVRT